jgi:plastocyanin
VLHKSMIATAIAIAIAIPLSLSACGGDDDTSSTTAAATTESTSSSTTASGGGGGGSSSVDISETEYQLDPADPTVAGTSGDVTINLTNDGGVTHNLEIEGNGVEEVSDDIEPGQSTTLKVGLNPGTYEIYCAIDDHKGLGMEGTLTVQ